MKQHQTFSEIENGKLTIELHELHRRPCVLPIVDGLAAAREWIEQHGGCAKLDADYSDGALAGWTIMRKYPEGHRSCGVIRPTT